MSEKSSGPKGNWAFPTSIKFGAGRISELAKTCKQSGISKPLLVTDPGLAGLAMVTDAITANNEAGFPTALFSDIKPNPTGTNLANGLQAYRDGGHDGIIAMGGGSAMDAGKTIALMVNTDVPWQQAEDKAGGWRNIKASEIAPWIAIPTTAGTGSEASAGSVIIDEEENKKRVIFHPSLLPVNVISDPALTVGLPPHLTAYTGLDAFTHCLEALCSPLYHPMADGIALEGMRLVKEALPVAVKDGANIAARSDMMSAATMGATAFMKGLGLVHALSHTVGGKLDTQHGLTNAVFLPYAMVYNRSAIEQKMTLAARYLGLREHSFEGMLSWVIDLREEMNIPPRSGSLGVTEELIPILAASSAEESTMMTNPKKAGVEEMTVIYQKSLAGDLG